MYFNWTEFLQCNFWNDALKGPTLSVDPTTGETHIRHHVTADGYYKGAKVIAVSKLGGWAPRINNAFSVSKFTPQSLTKNHIEYA